jgi:hypothetical protein
MKQRKGSSTNLGNIVKILNGIPSFGLCPYRAKNYLAVELKAKQKIKLITIN